MGRIVMIIFGALKVNCVCTIHQHYAAGGGGVILRIYTTHSGLRNNQSCAGCLVNPDSTILIICIWIPGIEIIMLLLNVKITRRFIIVYVPYYKHFLFNFIC